MQMVALDMVRVLPELQMRAAGVDAGTVEDYAGVYRGNPRGLPPICLAEWGEGLAVWDGFHRLAAAVVAGLVGIEAVVTPVGCLRDAIVLAAGANDSHGLRRTQADKRRAVAALLADAELAKLSDRGIAQHARVSHTYVANLRREMVAERQKTEDGPARERAGQFRRAVEEARKLGVADGREFLTGAPRHGFASSDELEAYHEGYRAGKELGHADTGRANAEGYKAGLAGKPETACPYLSDDDSPLKPRCMTTEWKVGHALGVKKRDAWGLADEEEEEEGAEEGGNVATQHAATVQDSEEDPKQNFVLDAYTNGGDKVTVCIGGAEFDMSYDDARLLVDRIMQVIDDALPDPEPAAPEPASVDGTEVVGPTLTKAQWRNVQKLQDKSTAQLLDLDLGNKTIYTLQVEAITGRCRREIYRQHKTKAACEREFRELRTSGGIDIRNLVGTDSNVPDAFDVFRGGRRHDANEWIIRAASRNWGIATDMKGGRCVYDTEEAFAAAWMELVIANDKALEC